VAITLDLSTNGRVSVIIPARDEEANIERVVRSVAAQAGVAEILVANDESRDRTAEILERLGSEFPSWVLIPARCPRAGRAAHALRWGPGPRGFS
jgi:glycosyltransferase involved in cell wall biosynthesis